jgi:hypothetical protein
MTGDSGGVVRCFGGLGSERAFQPRNFQRIAMKHEQGKMYSVE